ncbi:MAG: squalene/phytoene synthase family protein [Pseudomonadota bacterium]
MSDLRSHFRTLGIDTDEDLVLALPYTPRHQRHKVMALAGLAVAFRTIPNAVSEPPIGEIRLQWQREALDQTLLGHPPGGHPTLELMAQSGVLSQEIRDCAEMGIDARARFLYAQSFSSIEELLATYADAEGWFAVAVLKTLMPYQWCDVDPDDRINGSSFEVSLKRLMGAYALARWGRSAKLTVSHDLSQQSVKAVWKKARDEFHEQTRALKWPRRDYAGLVGALSFLCLGQGYAERDPGEPWHVMKRLTILRAVLLGSIT